jgi:hypothetical protein
MIILAWLALIDCVALFCYAALIVVSDPDTTTTSDGKERAKTAIEKRREFAIMAVGTLIPAAAVLAYILGAR